MSPIKSRGGHWVKFPTLIVRSGLWGRLPFSAKAVYGAIVIHIHSETYECYPSNGTIARLAGVHIKSVPQAIELLEKCGTLKRHLVKGKNRFKVHHDQELRKNIDAMGRYINKVDDQRALKPRLLRGRNSKGQFETGPLHLARPTPSDMDSPMPSQMATNNKQLIKIN